MLDLSSFPKSTSDEWFRTAQKQLKGEDPYSKLEWDSHGLNHLKPYYDLKDVKQLDYLTQFFSGIPSHRWKLYETIKVLDEKEANEKALAALKGGCDGVIFEPKNTYNQERLLQNIDQNICDVSVISDENDIKINGINTTNSIYLDAALATPLDQILKTLDVLSSSVKWVRRNAFNDFFLEIASVRALRYMLNYEKERSNVFIHTTVPFHESEEHQWFLNTSAALSAILGGSHSIDMPTTIGDNRITRNVGNLIRDESGVDQYEDQCGGSYLVEALTHQIIQQVKSNLK